MRHTKFLWEDLESFPGRDRKNMEKETWSSNLESWRVVMRSDHCLRFLKDFFGLEPWWVCEQSLERRAGGQACLVRRLTWHHPGEAHLLHSPACLGDQHTSNLINIDEHILSLNGSSSKKRANYGASYLHNSDDNLENSYTTEIHDFNQSTNNEE